MKKYYTMKECFDECEDDDAPFIEDSYNSLGKMSKKTLLTACPPREWGDLNSDRWQIKRAEPKVLSAERSLEEFKNKPGPIGYFDAEMISMFQKGQLWEYYRPEQVELRKAVKFLCGVAHHPVLEKALENLKPPYSED